MKVSNISKGMFKGHTEVLLNKMIDEIQDAAIILLDQTGHVIHWNKGAQYIKGYTEQEILGKHFRIFYPRHEQENNLPEKLLAEAAAAGRAVYEGWRVRKDGSLFWGNIVLTSLHDDDGEVIGYSKLTRDLTERKKAEDSLAAKNKELTGMNQELVSFAYVASHDLQEPLRKIQTFLSRIEEMEKERMSERGLDYFKRVQQASVRMQTLIQDLLAYSRATTDQRKFETVDLNSIVEGVKRELSETIREKRGVIESASLPQVNGIQFQLNQLFINLIGNSLKFSKPNVTPHIVIACEVLPAESVPLAHMDHAPYYQISIHDNGIGFEPEYNTKVFELFQRLHGRAEYGGTGIGLAICKKIVENHYGYITAEGRRDDGATFRICLPVPG
jgi:PAS domain S-box-containing protein